MRAHTHTPPARALLMENQSRLLGTHDVTYLLSQSPGMLMTVPKAGVVLQHTETMAMHMSHPSAYLAKMFTRFWPARGTNLMCCVTQESWDNAPVRMFPWPHKQQTLHVYLWVCCLVLPHPTYKTAFLKNHGAFTDKQHGNIPNDACCSAQRQWKAHISRPLRRRNGFTQMFNNKNAVMLGHRTRGKNHCQFQFLMLERICCPQSFLAQRMRRHWSKSCSRNKQNVASWGTQVLCPWPRVLAT